MSDAYSGVWECAFDEALRGGIDIELREESIAGRGAEWGAGWAFAIIGMAQAIRDTYCCRCGEHIGIGLMHFEHA